MANTEDLQKSLTTLAEVFAPSEGSSYKVSFDEFMREHEFGLALHSVCDFLMSEGTAQITLDRIVLVQELHAAMQLWDNCVSELEDTHANKVASSLNNNH
jgi:hypothetical protein